MSSIDDLRARFRAFDRETERLRTCATLKPAPPHASTIPFRPRRATNLPSSPHQPDIQPVTTKFFAPLHRLDNPLAVSVTTLLPRAWAKSTLNGYEGAIRKFTQFCDQHGIPEHLRFPTDDTVLAAYISSFAFHAAGSSAEKALSALKIWHDLSNTPWKGGTQLKYVLKAVKNCTPQESTRPQRPGVTIDMLNILHDELDLNSPVDAAIFAAATVAFWCMCRLGELLGTARRKHDARHFPSRSSLSGPPKRGVPLYLHLPCTKTSQLRGEKLRILEQFGRADPFYALSNHLHINRGIDPSSHLFAFRSTSGIIKSLTHETFIRRVNDIWRAHGFARITGHNFRIGGANTLMDHKVPFEIVKGAGRWRSGVFFKYWRKTEDKSAAYAQFLTRPSSRPAPARTRQGRLASPVDAA